MSTDIDHTGTADQVLDVREIDGPPFADIMAAIGDLGVDETLLLLVDFEPVPLYDQIADRGFTHDASQIDGVWHVMIQHD